MFGLKRIWNTVRPAKPVASPRSGSGSAIATVAARYSAALTDKELRQGEIITGLINYAVKADPADVDKVITSGLSIPYSIVATPDCDLLHSFHAIGENKPERINGVLFFEAEESGSARKKIGFGTKEWKLVSSNRWEGFHLLSGFQPSCDSLGEQIPDILVDFKRYFMLPTQEVYRQCKSTVEPKATRRCYLGDLWREQLQQRAMTYMQRVGTPNPDDEN
jgi:hypothetical protein